MANTLMTPPEEELAQAQPDQARRAAYVPNLGAVPELEKDNIFTSLMQGVKDMFAPKLPPLQLESTPIAVVDRMAVKRDPVSTGIAIGLHILVFLLIFFIGKRIIKSAIPGKPALQAISMDVPPVKLKPAATSRGGGGGTPDKTPVSQGHPPKISPTPIVPISRPPVLPPKLAIDPAINLQATAKMADNNLPNLGDPSAPKVGPMGLGMGTGGGLGNGNGNGRGNGSGGNEGGGTYRVGEGGVTAPKPTYTPDPDYSEEARKAKFQGVAIVSIIVDAQGRPTHIRSLRPLGMGLDEKAREAVAQWKFKPAMKDGKPVPVEINLEVSFQIF